MTLASLHKEDQVLFSLWFLTVITKTIKVQKCSKMTETKLPREKGK